MLATKRQLELDYRERKIQEKEQLLDIKKQRIDMSYDYILRKEKIITKKEENLNNYYHKLRKWYRANYFPKIKDETFNKKSTLYVFVPMIILTITLQVLLDVKKFQISTTNLIWALCVLTMIFISHIYSINMIKKHNEYAKKKGDY